MTREQRENMRPMVAQEVTQDSDHLYLMQSADGYLKVGRSMDPDKRLSAIQSGSPVLVQILKIWPGKGAWEREFHAALDQWRMMGEWFQGCKACRQAINELTGEVIEYPFVWRSKRPIVLRADPWHRYGDKDVWHPSAESEIAAEGSRRKIRAGFTLAAITEGCAA